MGQKLVNCQPSAEGQDEPVRWFIGSTWSYGAIAGYSLPLLMGLGVSQPTQAAPLNPTTRLAPRVHLAQVPVNTVTLFVNPAQGNDNQDGGSQRAPFRTITRALQVAQPGTVIQLMPGLYSQQTGEQFPLHLKSGITLQGDPRSQGRSTLIRGGGYFLSPTSARQDIAILVANRATLTGVTVTNPNFRGYGVWIESSNPNVTNNTFTGNTHDGISIVGKSTPLIRSNLFQRNGANGITIFGSARPEIRENIFDNTGFGINVGMNAAPQILQNRIRNNKDGVVVQASARPVLRGNLIENNQRDGLVAIALAIPDLGTRVQPGRNIIRGNGRFDVNNATKTQTTLAFGNQLLSSRIKGSVDLMGNARPVLEMATPPTLSPGTSVPTRTPVSARPPISIPVSPSPSVSSRPPISIPVPTASGVPTRSTIPISVPAPANLPDIPPPPPAPPINLSERVPVRPTLGSLPPVGNATNLPIVTSARPLPSPMPGGKRSTAISIPVPSPETVDVGSPAVPPPIARRTWTIPVPPPSSPTWATRTRSSGPLSTPPTSASRTRTIAVPPPESPFLTARTTTIPVPPPTDSSGWTPPPPPPAVDSSWSPSNVLPVPSPDIPIGSSRGRAMAVIPSSGPAQPATLELRYRVLVPVNREGDPDRVRQLVPGAFRTFTQGRVLMQAGAFSDRAKADEVVQLLQSNGLTAMVEIHN